MQPDGDGSCRVSSGFELAFRSINTLMLDAASSLGRFAKDLRSEGFNITNAVPDLGAKFEKYGSARFSTPAFSQLCLGHASSVHVLHPCVGVVRTPMKALERQEVKVGDFSPECRA